MCFICLHKTVEYDMPVFKYLFIYLFIFILFLLIN